MFQLKYMFPLLMLSSATSTSSTRSAAQPSLWTPYNMNLQQEQLNSLQNQFDQQNLASEYTYGFNSQENGTPINFEAQGYGDNQVFNFAGDHNVPDNHEFTGHIPQPHSYPVHEHVEETNPEPIKHYKEIIVPLPKNVEFKVNQPIIIPVPHPIPIQVPVPKAVVIPIVKEVFIPVEKSVPYPVTKTVHVPKIKEVPFEVVKHVIVPVDKPIPFKVPVYETIIHTKKGSHKI